MNIQAPPRPAGPAPAIDPRIRERRIAVTRHQGRRRLRALTGLLGAVTVVVLAVVVLHLSWFRVAHITVRGATRTGAGRVAAAADGALHQPIVSVDTAAVTRRVGRLPWVASARVDKRWPATLVVTVVERVAVAQVADGSRWALVDRTGRVLAVLPHRDGSVLALAWTARVPGPGGSLPAGARGPLAVAAGLAALADPGPQVAVPVVSVGPAPGSGGEVAVDLADGAVADLGAPVDLTAKLTALATLESQVDLTGVRAIDLRVPGQPVLTRG